MTTTAIEAELKWVVACDIADIPSPGARCVRTPQGNVALFRTGTGELFALEDRCPHRGGPLSQGMVFGGRVACPLHGMVFELESGAAVAPDKGEVQRYPVRREGERVLIGLPLRDEA